MTRKEGIIKTWNANKSNLPLTSDHEQKLLEFEYNNYLELCDVTGEHHLTQDQWLNQIIKPAHR